MMNEPRKSDVQKKLDDEERARRMKEGGEDMRAEYAMEQAERSGGGEGERGSSLGPEEERRRQMGREPHAGMGETQQAQMAMWGKSTERPYETGSMAPEPRRASTGEPFTSGPDITRERTTQEGPSERTYPAGTGSRYRDPNREPTGPASTGEPFTSGPEISGGERSSEVGRGSETNYPAGTGSRYRDPNREPTGLASTGEPFTSGPDISGGERSETGRRSETDYSAGTGSRYRDPGYRPSGYASTGEPFTSGPERRAGEAEERPVRGTTDYPAGTGSVYRDPNVQSYERASTGEYFTAGPEATGMAPRSPPSGYYAREEPSMTPGPVSKAKGMTQTVAEQTKAGTGKVVSTAAVKGKEVSHMVSGKAKELEESRGAEEFANRAGEVIGRTVRKTMAVAKELTSGLRKGISSSSKHEETAPERTEVTETRRVVREEEEK